MTNKEKRRNTEKRKEKSRDAARCRRSKETEVYSDLSQNLPLPQNVSNQLDKASIMRLSISYLNVFNILDLKRNKGDEESEEEQKMNALCSKALEGFLFILSKEGDIVYVSDTVAKYLGIQQIELIGQSIYEFTHPCDHDEIKDVMSVKPHNVMEPSSDERIFFIRMKCTLTSKGRNVNLKSASYKVLKFTGRLVTKGSPQENNEANGASSNVYPYLLAIGETIPHPANIEVPLDNNTFLTKHDMDMHFTYCDPRVKELVGYNCEELVGQSMYNYHHALDSHIVEKAFKDLFAKGQTMTGQYRMLAKNGGHVWVVTQGTIIYNNRTQKPQWVVCVHYVLSKIENKDAIVSEVQLPKPETFGFELSTDKIFTPKTKADMEQKYFVPPELKKKINFGEVEDLTHLAPMPSGACILGSEMFDSKIPGGLLSEFKEEPDTIPKSMCRQKHNYFASTSTSPASMSPRIGSPEDYRCMASPMDMDQMMHKFFTKLRTQPNYDSDVSKTPEMGSPDPYQPIASPDVMNTIFTKQSIDSDSSKTPELLDMSERSPYIPMDHQSDISLAPPSRTDLLKLNNDFNPGMFGKTESVFMPKEAIFEVPPQPNIRTNFRDLMGESTSMASMVRAPNMLPVQMKRPRDMNSLEKGPPKAKKIREDQRERGDLPMLGTDCNNSDNQDSVLLNLLLTGEDRSHGYKVKSPYMNFNGKGGNLILSTAQSLSNLASLLPTLTQQDYEVNAPTVDSRLLQGADLLQALDVDIPGYRVRTT